jgi:hypothetical protein
MTILEKSDLPLIKELALCMNLVEIAEKFDVGERAIFNFLAKKGTSKNQLVLEHRLPIIKQAIESKESTAITAKRLCMGRSNFTRYRKKVMPDFCYWRENNISIEYE